MFPNVGIVLTHYDYGWDFVATCTLVRNDAGNVAVTGYSWMPTGLNDVDTLFYPGGDLFSDGFETGDTRAWTSTVE